MIYKVCKSEGGKVVNRERRTWVTIYITLKWDPEHVFPSVRPHDQLMDSQKPTCFLLHCTVSFFSGLRLSSGPVFFFSGFSARLSRL